MPTKEKQRLRITYIEHRDIWPSPDNPREFYDEKEMDELRDSIREDGILSPIAVRLIRNAYNGANYQIIYGERRWRASEDILDEMPCIIFDVSDEKAHEMRLDENFQRADLRVEEEAKLVQEYLAVGFSREQIGKKRKKGVGWVNNRIAYMNVGEDVRAVGKRIKSKAMSALVIADKVKDGHLKDSLRKSLLKRIEFNELSYRDTKVEVDRWVANNAIEKRAAANAAAQAKAPDTHTEVRRNAFNRGEVANMSRGVRVTGGTPLPASRVATLPTATLPAATPEPANAPDEIETIWTPPIAVVADAAPAETAETTRDETGDSITQDEKDLAQMKHLARVMAMRENETRAQKRAAQQEANAEVERATATLEAFIPLCNDETFQRAKAVARRILRGDLARK